MSTELHLNFWRRQAFFVLEEYSISTITMDYITKGKSPIYRYIPLLIVYNPTDEKNDSFAITAILADGKENNELSGPWCYTFQEIKHQLYIKGITRFRR